MWLESGENLSKTFHCHPGFSLSANVLMKTNSPCLSLLMGQVLFLSLPSCNSLEEDPRRGTGILSMAGSCASCLAPENLQAV